MLFRHGFIMLCVLALLRAVCAPLPALPDGIALVGIGDYAEAITVLKPLSDAQPDDSVLQYWLGRAYYGQRLFRLAASSLDAAAERDPRNAEACRWHARAVRMAGEMTTAMAAYDDYLHRFPLDNVLLREAATAHAAAGDYPGARAAFALLRKRDPSPDTGALVDAWNAALAGLSTKTALEPEAVLRRRHYTVQCDLHDPALSAVLETVDAARQQMSDAFGITMTGFRVLLFPTWNQYSRYARIFLPEGQELHAAAFSMPGTLVIWSPSAWPTARATPDEARKLLTHEMAHLALAQRTRAEGVPVWLNEGLACHLSGWGGMQSGRIADPPLTLRQLERAFSVGNAREAEQAYAQAQAMIAVLVRQLGLPALPRLLDLLANGTLLPDAYRQLSGEDWEKFLAEWAKR